MFGGVTHLSHLLFLLILVPIKIQVDVWEFNFFVYLFAVVVFSVCSFVLEAIHIVFDSEGELAVEQGHRERIVLGFFLLGTTAFSLVHNPLQVDILIYKSEASKV